MNQETTKARHRRRRDPGDVRAALALRPGFTLVELLVALGLVSLLMVLFAEVFTVATGTMSTQRGIMENDQRARTLETVLMNDLKNRSMGSVIAFLPNEVDPAGNGNPLNLPLDVYQFGNTNREGFLSISENNLFLDDDVLHFTVFLQDASAEPYYGRATALPAGTTDITTNPNQPEADDGQITPNSTATSRSAEIVYFVRNGNLYRRVLLIRNPLDPSFNLQPSDGAIGQGMDMLDPANGYYSATGAFWNDFDFAARFGAGGFAQFLGPLDNSGTGSFPIAIPLNRFGHDPDTGNTHAASGGFPASVGNPREFVFGTPATAGAPPTGNQNQYFIGRFTHEETSHPNFRFPQAPSTVGNPMDQDVQLTLNANGVITQFAGGPRRGEDILLTNVHGLDVKVWDEIIGDYVDLGHGQSNASGMPGDFHQGRNRRPTYGPQVTATNIMFDTWHPQFNANNDDDGGSPANPVIDGNDSPPFVPKYGYPLASPNGHTWVTGGTYDIYDSTPAIPTIVVPTSPTTELLAYRATGNSSGNPTGVSGGAEPAWPTQVGDSVVDGDITWTAIPNIKRLKSLQITVRYLDVTSDQMRQVTLIQSLVD